MFLLAFQAAAESGGQLGEVARTFGVDWPHLGAQIISFGIVCFIMYKLAYTPILTTLEARRQQIASGLANAEKIKAELARIEAERQNALIKAGAEGKQIVARSREAAERERAQMLTEAKGEIGRLVIQTAATVTGRILTADDQRRLAEETARQLAV